MGVDKLLLDVHLQIIEHARVELDRATHSVEPAQLEVIDVTTELRAVVARGGLGSAPSRHIRGEPGSFVPLGSCCMPAVLDLLGNRCLRDPFPRTVAGCAFRCRVCPV